MILINKIKTTLIFALLMILPLIGNSQAEGDSMFSAEMAPYLVITMVFFLALIVLGVSFNVYNIMRTFVTNEAIRKAQEAGVEYVPEAGWFSKLMDRWNDIVPIEEESSITLDHEYDGIRELDNHLPPWWLGLFYGSVVFGVIYMIGYHVMDWWPLQEEEYSISQAEAAKVLASQAGSQGVIDESTIEYNPDVVFVSKGKAVFDQSCATCHGPDGGGTIGPNLVDNYWMHGGSVSDIYKTIKNGVPAKGMASWEKALSPTKIAQITSYIISIGGSEVANPKAPQGDLIEPETSEESAPETSEPVNDAEDSGSSGQDG